MFSLAHAHCMPLRYNTTYLEERIVLEKMSLLKCVKIIQIQSSGGYKGGARNALPGHANSPDFMQFSGKFGKIVC